MAIATSLGVAPWMAHLPGSQLSNGGFEAPRLAGWSATGSGWVPAASKTGTCIQAGVPESWLNQDLPASFFLPYLVTVEVRSRVTGTAEFGGLVHVTFLGTGQAERGDRLFGVPVGDDWQRHRFLVWSPTGTRSLRLGLGRLENAEVWFDDVSIHPMATVAGIALLKGVSIGLLGALIGWAVSRSWKSAAAQDVLVTGALCVLVGSWGLFFVSHTEPPPIHSDALNYRSMMENILSGHGLRFENPTVAEFVGALRRGESGAGLPGPIFSTYRAPLYPVFCAAVTKTFGHFPDSVYRAQAVGQAIAAMALYLVARTLLGITGSVFIAAMAALDMTLVSRTSYILLESFMFTLVCLAGALTVLAIRWQGWTWALAGLAWGIVTLAKSVTLFIPGMLAVLCLRRAPRPRFDRRAWTKICLGFALVILPWTTRNFLLTGRFIPVHTGQFWWTIWSVTQGPGAFSPADPRVRPILIRALEGSPRPSGQDIERVFREETRRAYATIPAGTLVDYWGGKLKKFWFAGDWSWWWDWHGGRSLSRQCYDGWLRVHDRLMTIVGYLSLASPLVWFLERKKALWVPIMVCGYFAVFYAPAPFEARYADPIRGLQYIMAGFSLAALHRGLRRFAGDRWTRWPVRCALTVGALIPPIMFFHALFC